MGDTLQKRIHTLIKQVFDTGDGAWLVWCDPAGHWLPLLRRVATDRRMGEVDLVEVQEQTLGMIGGPVTRRELQQRIDAGESFVLYVPVAPADLGWLWGQALLAERIYATTLRGQLMEWGWWPHSLTVSDEEVATLARTKLQQDPIEWGSDGLQPDLEQFLDVLAGLREPDDESQLLLNLTAEQAGLPIPEEHDLDAWRRQCLATLLVTQAHDVAPDMVPETHPRVITGPARTLALDMVARWVDSHRLAVELPNSVKDADVVAALTGLLSRADVRHGPFVSHAAERACFSATCSQLAQLEGRHLLEALAAAQVDIDRHKHGPWGLRMADQAMAVPWGELGRLSAAAGELLGATPTHAWSTPQQAIDWYVGGGWRMDRAGEEIERALETPASELATLIVPLRNAYRARWEETAIQWSNCWDQAGCPLPAKLGTAGAWLRAALDAAKAPTVVLIVDALRFDLGAMLADRLNRQEGAQRAKVDPARAPLPSITALGMGTALPIPEEQLEADIVAEKWQLVRKGSSDNLSVADVRRNWWTQQPKTTVVDKFAELASGETPAPTTSGQRLIIYDGAIDRMGHDDELAFQGSEVAVKRYLHAIERLRDAGWRRILLVTDHGFIRWADTQEHHVSFPQPQPPYASRRAAAYAHDVPWQGPHGDAPGGKWRVVFPHGVACFRTYGGLGYFHGGASLQEWIIPCVAIEWPQTAKPVEVQVEPVNRILTQRPKITLNVVRENLLAEDNIPRTVEILIRNASTQQILFRSSSFIVTGERAQIEETLQTVEGASAVRTTPLTIQVREAHTEALIAEAASTLMIELGGW